MDDAKEVVIVPGSSGYIGSALIKKFAERYRLVGLDRENPPHPPPVAECVCIDLTSDASTEAALQRVRTAYGERIASVIHLGAGLRRKRRRWRRCHRAQSAARTSEQRALRQLGQVRSMKYAPVVLARLAR